MEAKNFLVFFVVLVAVSGCGNIEDARSLQGMCKDCTIILISADTLRADRMGAYGYWKNTTPNIDSELDRSVIFDNTFSQASWTTPSHMSLFTSLYPWCHMVNSRDQHLSEDVGTIAEYFEKKGYSTTWIGIDNTANLNHRGSFGRGFGSFESNLFMKTKTSINSSILDSVFKKNGSKFVFIHSYVNHDPFIYPPEFNERFSNKDNFSLDVNTYPDLNRKYVRYLEKEFSSDPDQFLARINATVSDMNEVLDCMNSTIATCGQKIGTVLGWQNLADAGYSSTELFFTQAYNDESARSEIGNKYDNGVVFFDHLMGQIFEYVDQNNLSSSTLIVLTSDHGEEIFEHGWHGHFSLYDHSIHVPLIVFSDRFGHEKRVASMMESVDIFPLITYLVEDPNSSQREYAENPFTSDDRYSLGMSLGQSYVRSHEWKYILSDNGTEELYHLGSDPQESQNVAHDDGSLSIKKELSDELELRKLCLRQ